MPTFIEVFDLLKQEANTANAVSALASAIAALLALFVSVVSLVVSVVALRHQRRHNVLSVKPFPEVTVADFEDALRVKLRNHGSGPLVVKSLKVKSGSETCRTLIDCLPELPGRHWTNFSGVIDGRSLLPGSEIVLVELAEEDGDLLFSSSRDLARRGLSQLTIHLEYTDAYGSDFKPYKKGLEWFGRHWS